MSLESNILKLPIFIMVLKFLSLKQKTPSYQGAYNYNKATSLSKIICNNQNK